MRSACRTSSRPAPESRFGAPRRSGVALRTIAFATSAADQSRCVAHTIAAAPVTSGAANDVPDRVIAVSALVEMPERSTRPP